MALTRKSDIVAIAASSTTLIAAGSSENVVVSSLILGNVDGTNDGEVALHLIKSGESSVDIVNTVAVAAGEALQVFVGGKDSLFLEAGDELAATAGEAGDVNATVSYIVET
jgi:hypothetical protein